MGGVLVLVTRPREAAEAFADELRRLGHEVLIEPMLTARPLQGVKLDVAHQIATVSKLRLRQPIGRVAPDEVQAIARVTCLPLGVLGRG